MGYARRRLMRGIGRGRSDSGASAKAPNSSKTAYAWYRQGTMPWPTRKVGTRTIIVEVSDDDAGDGVGLYARVSSSGQRGDLDRQLSRLCEWAARGGLRVVRTESEVASGVNGNRAKLRRMLEDPSVRTVVVERRDRLGRTNVERTGPRPQSRSCRSKGLQAKPTAPGSDAEEARQPAKRSHRSRPPTAAVDSGNTAHVPRHRAQTPKREPAQHRGQGTPTVHGARPADRESQPLPTR